MLYKEVKKNNPIMNYMENTSATEVATMIKKGGSIIGLTRGKFSLIDLIFSILNNIGGGDVVCATWSAGIKDANTVRWMLDTNLIRSFMLITDHSYVTRQKKYAVTLDGLFGKENIRTSDIHGKFVLISNENYKITIRSSMNLNANKTCETFEIDESESIYSFYEAFVVNTFGEMPKGFIADSSAVNRALDRVFSNLSNQFSWQNNE